MANSQISCNFVRSSTFICQYCSKRTSVIIHNCSIDFLNDKLIAGLGVEHDKKGQGDEVIKDKQEELLPEEKLLGGGVRTADWQTQNRGL